MVRWFPRVSGPVALALALSGAAWGSTATGLVQELGRPVVGAAVVVDGGDPVFTNQDGRYSADVDAGDHKINVALHGYKPMERAIKAVADKDVIADFILEPVVQLAITTAPTSLARGASGTATVVANNTGATEYSIDAVGLRVYMEDKDRSADFTIQPSPTNAASVKPGQTVTLTFTVTPMATAATGRVALRASMLGFDTALGKNLIPNSSFETVSAAGKPASWAFSTDNKNLSPDAKGTVVAAFAMTGSNSGEVRVPAAEAGDVRSYWTNPRSIKKNQKYVLSGYIKTENVLSDASFGASVYVPITGNDPYQQPNSPWITGTRDWRKSIIAFETADNGSGITGHCRGEIQQGTGVAWFDNLCLTEGAADGGLTVTSADQSLEVTG